MPPSQPLENAGFAAVGQWGFKGRCACGVSGRQLQLQGSRREQGGLPGAAFGGPHEVFRKPYTLKCAKKNKPGLSGVGFEPTPPIGDQNTQMQGRAAPLESGALDHSATLTAMGRTGKDSSVPNVARCQRRFSCPDLCSKSTQTLS